MRLEQRFDEENKPVVNTGRHNDFFLLADEDDGDIHKSFHNTDCAMKRNQCIACINNLKGKKYIQIDSRKKQHRYLSINLITGKLAG